MQELEKKLIDQYSASPWEIKNPHQAYVFVEKAKAVEALTALQGLHGYNHLSFFTVVDQIEAGHFELIYMIHNYQTNHDLGVTVKIERENSVMDSIHHLWPAAMTYQRENREMYGIDFPGTPRLQENFVLEGWEDIPPMRREFDTKEYSEKTFYARPGRTKTTPRQHMKEKLYPSEAETW